MWQTLINNKFVQAVFVALIIFMICWIANITVNIEAGANGFHFGITHNNQRSK